MNHRKPKGHSRRRKRSAYEKEHRSEIGLSSKRPRLQDEWHNTETIGATAIEAGNIPKQQRRILFDKILKSIANTDWFVGEDSPNFFLVYAHDNDAVGQANAVSAKKIIEWLNDVHSKLLSDKSPTFSQSWYTREGGAAAAHDILSNQFCLLPWSTRVNQHPVVRSVQNVILCWSEVLQRYWEHDLTATYIKAIEDFYSCAQRDCLNDTDIQEGIRKIEGDYRNKDGFHHVCTELAFLNIRLKVARQKGDIQDIIPVILSGDSFKSTPYFGKFEPVLLKAFESASTTPELGTLHKTFFNLLGRIYEDQSRGIAEFRKCYDYCIESVPQGATSTDFKAIIKEELSKCTAFILRHNTAHIRTIPKTAIAQSTFLETLNFPEMGYREQEIFKAEDDSCTWIENHSSYKNWMQKNGGILGIRGKPGSGKSTLLKKIFRSLQSERTHNVVQIAYFYHRRGTPLQHTEIGMYRTLLYQLLKAVPRAGSKFQQLAEEKSKWQKHEEKIWQWRVEELREALSDALLEASESCKLRIFVDALDEAGNKIALDIASHLRSVNRYLLNADRNVSICFSCRKYPNVPVDEGFEISVDDENQDDISKYVFSQFKETLCSEGDHVIKEKDVNSLHEIIIEKADGVFMWVALVVPLLAKFRNDGYSVEKLRKKIVDVPSDLEEVYRHIVTNVIDQATLQDTLHLMQWVYFAGRPLTVSEMRVALALDDKYTEAGKPCPDLCEFADDDLGMKKLVKSLTGGLAEVISHPPDGYDEYQHPDTIQFIHQSVNDYLSRDGFKFIGLEGSVNLVGESHDRLSRSCINYIKFVRNLEHVIATKIFSGDTNKRLGRDERNNLSFAEYAETFWKFHAERAELNGFLQQSIIDRLQWPANHIITDWVTLYIACHIRHPWGHEQANPGEDLFHAASGASLYSVVTELIRRGVDVNEKDSDGHTALHYAASKGDTKMVEKLLWEGRAELVPKDKKGQTPLGLAAERGNRLVLEMLVKEGDDVNSPQGESGTALQSAALRGQILTVQWLLQEGAEVNAQGGRLGNALQAGAYAGSKEVVQVLLDAGAKVNAQGGRFGNALQAGAYAGSKEVVQLLLDVGAEVNAQGDEFGNVLQAAREADFQEVVEMLLHAGAKE